jgi:hypothetical protein
MDESIFVRYVKFGTLMRIRTFFDIKTGQPSSVFADPKVPVLFIPPMNGYKDSSLEQLAG